MTTKPRRRKPVPRTSRPLTCTKAFADVEAAVRDIRKCCRPLDSVYTSEHVQSVVRQAHGLLLAYFHTIGIRTIHEGTAANDRWHLRKNALTTAAAAMVFVEELDRVVMEETR